MQVLLQSLSGVAGIDVGGLMVDLQNTLKTVSEPRNNNSTVKAANGAPKSTAPLHVSTTAASGDSQRAHSASEGRVDDEGIDDSLIELANSQPWSPTAPMGDSFKTIIKDSECQF